MFGCGCLGFESEMGGAGAENLFISHIMCTPDSLTHLFCMVVCSPTLVPPHTTTTTTTHIVMIETHNAHAQMGLSSFYLGHNEYSDLTHYEFRQVMKLGEFARPELVLGVGEKKEFKFALLEEEAAMSNTNNLRGPSMETVPATAIERKLSWSSSSDDDEVDWHTKGLLGPIRNQGICGACWAFAAIGSIESAMAIDKYNQMEPTEREKLLVHLKNGSDLGLVIPLSEQNLIDCDTRLEKGCEGGL